MKNKSVRYIAKVGVLSAAALILYLIEIPLTFMAPSFYKLDLSDLAALLGGFSLGPAAGVLIELIKNILHFIKSSTFGVGELANFAIGCCLVLPASFIYKYRKKKSGALLGLLAGTLVMTAFGSLLNAFVMLPFYANVFHMPIDTIVSMGAEIYPGVVGDLWSFILLIVAPFNLLKGIICSAICFLLYKPLSPLLHK